MSDRSPNRQSGSTVVEVVAALIVASAILVGFLQISTRFAEVTEKSRSVGQISLVDRMSQRCLAPFERSDPGTLLVRGERIEARLGRQILWAQLDKDEGAAYLTCSSSGDAVTILGVARFRLAGERLLLLEGAQSPPFAAARILRSPLPARDSSLVR